MIDDVARQQAMDHIAELLDLDEFQKMAAMDIMRDIDKFEWPPAPGSEHERKIMELGAIIVERIP